MSKKKFMFKGSFLVLFLLLLLGCQKQETKDILDDLNELKREFLDALLSSSEVEEGPFHMNYNLRTVFFSKEIVSLFGTFNEYKNLPHSWGCYEGKTFCRVNGKFREVTIDDLFKTGEQKEFLRNYCQEYAKNRFDYFSGKDPIHTEMQNRWIHTFVVDDKLLRIIFQPYAVGSYVEGPFIAEIPYKDLKGHWEGGKILMPLLEKTLSTQEYISSWDEEEYFRQLG